jgi:hypothetical protein
MENCVKTFTLSIGTILFPEHSPAGVLGDVSVLVVFHLSLDRLEPEETTLFEVSHLVGSHVESFFLLLELPDLHFILVLIVD